MTAAKPVIAVLGAGSWGTALAVLIARNGYHTLLWGHDAARQARLAHERENARYLPGVRFPDTLLIREDLLETAEEAAHLLVVVPSHAFRATLEALKPRLPAEAIVAWATKGLEPATGRLLSQVAAEVLGEGRALGVISGPTFAKEVAQGLPTAVTVAAHEAATAEAIAVWLRGDRVRVYTSTDL
ncbi:MAG: glycerol-3-phosphate dehydrogenase, partial [Proteobacteria bacterium]|nr:glycerol-3-phosphate dehydrogenase [Pseudomonadota bacterium]